MLPMLGAAVLAAPAALIAPPFQPATASWYYDGGTTASGIHYAYGYASLMFGGQWGHRVQFQYNGQRVTGRLDDHGPYVGGRAFDLNQTLRAALRCPDLCNLQWRNLPGLPQR